MLTFLIAYGVVAFIAFGALAAIYPDKPAGTLTVAMLWPAALLFIAGFVIGDYLLRAR